MKTKTVSEPLWGGPTAARNMAASAEWLKANRQEQIQAGIVAFTNPTKTFFPQRPAAIEIMARIGSAANTIRSWHAWGEPSDYGKAVCARLREEIICYATIRRVIAATDGGKRGVA